MPPCVIVMTSRRKWVSDIVFFRQDNFHYAATAAIKLVEMNPPKKKKAKKKMMTHKKKGSQPPPPLFDPKQRLHLDKEVDSELRSGCEGVTLI